MFSFLDCKKVLSFEFTVSSVFFLSSYAVTLEFLMFDKVIEIGPTSS